MLKQRRTTKQSQLRQTLAGETTDDNSPSVKHSEDEEKINSTNSSYRNSDFISKNTGKYNSNRKDSTKSHSAATSSKDRSRRILRLLFVTSIVVFASALVFFSHFRRNFNFNIRAKAVAFLESIEFATTPLASLIEAHQQQGSFSGSTIKEENNDVDYELETGDSPEKKIEALSRKISSGVDLKSEEMPNFDSNIGVVSARCEHYSRGALLAAPSIDTVNTARIALDSFNDKYCNCID